MSLQLVPNGNSYYDDSQAREFRFWIAEYAPDDWLGAAIHWAASRRTGHLFADDITDVDVADFLRDITADTPRCSPSLSVVAIRAPATCAAISAVDPRLFYSVEQLRSAINDHRRHARYIVLRDLQHAQSALDSAVNRRHLTKPQVQSLTTHAAQTLADAIRQHGPNIDNIKGRASELLKNISSIKHLTADDPDTEEFDPALSALRACADFLRDITNDSDEMDK